jgi:hypothetical protein
MFGRLWWTVIWQGFERKRSMADAGTCLEGLTKTTKPGYRLRFWTEYKKMPTIHLLCSRQLQLSALVSKLCFTWRRRLGRYTTPRAGAPRNASLIPDRVKMFLFFEPSRTALGPTQRVQTALSQCARRPGHECEYSPPSVTTFRMPGGTPPLTFFLFL